MYDIPANADAVHAFINSRPPPGHRLDSLCLYTYFRPSNISSINLLEPSQATEPESAPFANLTQLTIGEDVFRHAVPFPRAPVLKNLAVLLKWPSDGVDFAHETVFLLPRDDTGAFECPSLHQLMFSAPDDEPIMTMDPTLVREFIEGYLRFDSATLPVLLLRHTRLLENSAEDGALLLARVETLAVTAETSGSTVSSLSDMWSSIITLRQWG